MTTLHSWRVLEPDGFYRSFINKEERPDGRPFLKARPLTVKIGSINTAEGSATVRYGNTSVVCGVKAEIAIPTLDQPDKGYVVPNVELYPCCSANVKAGPPGEKAMVTSQLLSKVMKSSKIIDLKSLCIVPDKYVWCLYIDVACLDLDGNLTDASVLAATTALADVRLPHVTYDEEEEKLKIDTEAPYTKLELKSMPTSTTFSCYSSDVHLLDPSCEDEDESKGQITIILKDKDDLLLTSKTGGVILTEDTLQSFISVAKERSHMVEKYVSEAITQQQMDES